MQQWIEEFLYRGRPSEGPGSETPPEFHVVIKRSAPNPFDNKLPPISETLGPLTPTQAEVLGWDLTKITESINIESAKECDSNRAEITKLSEDLEARTARVAELERHAEYLSQKLSLATAALENEKIRSEELQARFDEVVAKTSKELVISEAG